MRSVPCLRHTTTKRVLSRPDTDPFSNKQSAKPPSLARKQQNKHQRTWIQPAVELCVQTDNVSGTVWQVSNERVNHAIQSTAAPLTQRAAHTTQPVVPSDPGSKHHKTSTLKGPTNNALLLREKASSSSDDALLLQETEHTQSAVGTHARSPASARRST